jgi:parallel beta-helix repeat protein
MHTTTKKIKSMIILLLFFSFVLAFSKGFTAKAEPKTIVVPDDFLSVFDAVEAASEGDTIYVKSGTYDCPVNQTLMINKTISLIGEDKSCTVLNFVPPLVQTSIPFSLTPVWARDAPIRIVVNNVTISGFTIDTIGKTGMVKPEITGTGSNTRIVDNNILTGVYLKSGSHQTVTENNITGMLRVYGSHQTITENTVTKGIEGGSSYNKITNNVVTAGGDVGIYVSGSFNIIYGNNVSSSGASGIKINREVTSNIIAKNIITGSGNGIHVPEGFNNTFIANRVTNCGYGINVERGSNNTFYANYIANNQMGARIGYDQSGISREMDGPKAFHNILYHNNFIDNSKQAVDWNWLGTNYWDNGKEGNYWSNYNGTDNNKDGIGDVPYTLSEAVSFYAPSTSSTDPYPLIAPITIFDAGTWEWTSYNVDVISNSSVSDFSFNPESALVRFSVEGETGTTGFCRVTIPKDFLDAEDYWTVLVDGASVTPTVNEDANSAYLYFTYRHSTKTVEIIGTNAIPEFPSWIILPLFLMTALFAVILKKHIRYLSET